MTENSEKKESVAEELERKRKEAIERGDKPNIPKPTVASEPTDEDEVEYEYVDIGEVLSHLEQLQKVIDAQQVAITALSEDLGSVVQMVSGLKETMPAAFDTIMEKLENTPVGGFSVELTQESRLLLAKAVAHEALSKLGQLAKTEKRIIPRKSD